MKINWIRHRLALSHLSNEYPTTEPGFYFTLANIEQQDHKPEKAFETLKKGYILQDSLYKNNIAHSYTVMRNCTIKKRQKPKTRNFASQSPFIGRSAISIVSSLLLYFIYKNRLNKRSREMAESQMRVLETEKRITKLQELLHHLNQTPKTDRRNYSFSKYKC